MVTLLVDVLIGLVMAMLVYGALHDFAARTVPNAIPVVIFFVGGALRAIEHDLARGLLVAAVSFAILLPLWMARIIGGGDVKLWTAMAMVLPPALPDQIGFLVSVALLGGALAIAYLALHRVVVAPVFLGVRNGSLVRRALRAEAWRIARRGPLPYGVAIAGAGLLVLAPSILGRIGG